MGESTVITAPEARPGEVVGVRSSFSQVHTPQITAPQQVEKDAFFEVSVTTGFHDREDDDPRHYIEWIELFFGSTFLFKINLSGPLRHSSITLPVRLDRSGCLQVWQKCSLHGLWKSTHEISVVD